LEKQKIIIAEKIKIKMREAMWKKLKEEQLHEIQRRETLRKEVLKKMDTLKVEKQDTKDTFNPAG